MTKKDQVKEWIKKHDICGNEPWFDKGTTYYTLTADQIISIHQHLKKNERID